MHLFHSHCLADSGVSLEYGLLFHAILKGGLAQEKIDGGEGISRFSVVANEIVFYSFLLVKLRDVQNSVFNIDISTH